MMFCGIHKRAISKWVPNLLFCIVGLTIAGILLKLLPHCSGPNELNHIHRPHFPVTSPHSCVFVATVYHYNGVIMSAIASQITSLTIVYSTVSRRRSKKTRKLPVSGLYEGNLPVSSPHKGPVTRKSFHLMTSSCQWWRHIREMFSALLAHCMGNQPVTVESPHKGPVMSNLEVLLCWWHYLALPDNVYAYPVLQLQLPTIC